MKGGQAWWGLVKSPYRMASDDFHQRLRALPYIGTFAGAAYGRAGGLALADLYAAGHLVHRRERGALVTGVVVRRG